MNSINGDIWMSGFDELSSVTELKLYLQQWAGNPKHWTNNKRRMSGRCTLRGKSNRKDRYLPPNRNLAAYISAIIDDAMPEMLYSFFDGLADIRHM